MSRNKKHIAHLAAIATLVGTGIAILQFAKSGFSAFAAVAVLIVLWALCLILHAYDRLCLPSELDSVIRTIAKTRKEYLDNSHLSPMWPRKYEQLCFCLQCHMFLWDVRLFHPGLSKLLRAGTCSDGRSEEDETGLSIENALSDLLFCLTKDSLVDAVLDWAVVSEDESSPAMGINNRGEVLEPDYSIKNKYCLSDKILKRIEDWFGKSDGDPRPVSILLIGANDQKLTKMIIEGIRNYRKCACIRLSMTGMTKANVNYIRTCFGGDDKSGNADRIAICHEQDKYDIIIVTHYYQHHCEECFRRELPAYSSRLDTNGIMVWLSAVSRTNAHDEYVCEGCTPMNPVLAHTGTDGAAMYAVVGEYPVPKGRHYINYRPMHDFTAHRALLGNEFPRTFFVSKDELVEHGIAKTCKLYLLWERNMDESQKREGNLMFKFRELSKAARLFEEHPEVPNISVDAEVKSGASMYGISSYALVSASLNGAEDKMRFIVTVGTESYEWNNGLRTDEERVTIYPAVRYDCVRQNYGLSYSARDRVLECIKWWKGARYDSRYGTLLPEKPCAEKDGNTVWRLHTRIKDVDLNDYMIFAHDASNAALERFYIAAFPTKRYLTAHGFAKLLGRMNRFKLLRSALPENNETGFRPTLACSATWLCSYRNLRHAFRGAGLAIASEDCYFHKCYGSLPKNSGEEKRLKGFDEILTDSKVSTDKDKAFNRLGLQDRLRLLETMNVHDLLLFATKSPETARRCQWWRRYVWPW